MDEGKKATKKAKGTTTSKKVKQIGTKYLVDPKTGEQIPMILNVLEDRDFNFHKAWLTLLVQSIDGIINQRLRLALWIVDHLDRENKLVMTQRTIAAKSGMSYQTVSRTMSALQKGNPPFLVKINSGAYQVNPNVLWKGSYANRMGVLYEFKEHVRDANPNANDPYNPSEA